eukprot:2388979-Amphidinium_carterae.1
MDVDVSCCCQNLEGPLLTILPPSSWCFPIPCLFCDGAVGEWFEFRVQWIDGACVLSITKEHVSESIQSAEIRNQPDQTTHTLSLWGNIPLLRREGLLHMLVYTHVLFE